MEPPPSGGGVAEVYGRSSLAHLLFPARGRRRWSLICIPSGPWEWKRTQHHLVHLNPRTGRRSDGGVDSMFCSKVCETDLQSCWGSTHPAFLLHLLHQTTKQFPTSLCKAGRGSQSCRRVASKDSNDQNVVWRCIKRSNSLPSTRILIHQPSTGQLHRKIVRL